MTTESVFTNDLQVATVDQERDQLPRHYTPAEHIRQQIKAIASTAHYPYAIDTVLLTNGTEIVAGVLIDTVDDTSLDFEIVNQWWVKILGGWNPLPADEDDVANEIAQHGSAQPLDGPLDHAAEQARMDAER